jgi:phage tail-like protein
MVNRIDPYFGFRFRLEIQGIIEAGFTEFSGLQATTQVEEFIEGGVNTYVHKFPKETTFENLVLKKGLGDSAELWQWHRDVISNNFQRRDVQIFLLKDTNDANIAAAQQWSFRQAYPVKWTGPEFKADSNTVAFETLELAHHGYTETFIGRTKN